MGDGMTSRSVEDYLDLVTSAHNQKPKFMAMLQACVEPFVAAREFIASLPQAFDLDYAVGVQLDTDGQWINLSREIINPIPDPWFRLDEAKRGLDYGLLFEAGYDSGSYVVALNDDTYRKLLKARILANHWDGTPSGAKAVLNAFFNSGEPGPAMPPYSIPDPWFVLDGFNPAKGLDGGYLWMEGVSSMDVSAWTLAAVQSRINTLFPDGLGPSYYIVDDQPGDLVIIAIAGHIPDPVTLEIFAGDYLPLRASGAETMKLVTSLDNYPIMGLDMDNQYVGGLDAGALGVPPSTIIQTPL